MRALVETIVIDSLERIANEEAVRVLILALTRLPNDENILVRSSLERVRGKTSDPAIKQEIERALAPQSRLQPMLFPYATKRCSMKRKSIGSGIQSSSG